MVSPQDRVRLPWINSATGDVLESTSYLKDGWNRYYSNKYESKWFYKESLRQLNLRPNVSKEHMKLVIASGIEWGVDYEELMRFLRYELKWEIEAIKDAKEIIKNKIADGSRIPGVLKYYNIKNNWIPNNLKKEFNQKATEDDTNILCSLIDKHEVLKQVGSRKIKVDEIIAFLKVKETNIMDSMKLGRARRFIGRILKDHGYTKHTNRTGCYWENPNVVATKKVKLQTPVDNNEITVAKPVDAKTTAIKLMYQWARWHIKQNDGEEIFIQDVVEFITKKCPQYGDAVTYSSLKDDIAKTVFNKFGYVRKGWSGLYVKHTVS